MLSLVDGSFALRKTVSNDPNIPDGTYTLARWHLSALYGGTTFTNNIAADGDPLVRMVSPCTMEQGLHVKGDITCDGAIKSPFHCAGKVNGANVSVSARKGRSVFQVARPSGRPVGIYRVTFTTPHPDGDNYVVSLAVQVFNGSIKVWEFSTFVPNSTSFHVVIMNTSNALVDADWHFSVIA